MLVLHLPAERGQFGDAGALAHAELDAAVADEVEAGYFFRDARRMVGGQLADAVAEADVPGPLAGGGEEGFRRR